MMLSDFMIHFSELEDPRITNHNSRHKFIDILVIGFIATLCSCDDWKEVENFANSRINFFKHFLELPNGIPSSHTFRRVFSVIDLYHFEEIFTKWMQHIYKKTKGEVIAIDGKTIRASRTKNNTRGIHVVNAWACSNKITLSSMKVDEKTNEITIMPKLLKILDIENCTITVDAMGCQKQIAAEVIKNKGNYVLCVKGNQPDLKENIAETFTIIEQDNKKKHADIIKQTKEGHGRKETRIYSSLPIEYLPELEHEWKGIKAITKVTRIREIDEKKTMEINYYISSHNYLSVNISNAIRRHWNIENCLHWQLDVSFNEDSCRARAKNEAANLALLRKISLAILKKDKTKKCGIKGKRKIASWDEQYLSKILAMEYGV